MYYDTCSKGHKTQFSVLYDCTYCPYCNEWTHPVCEDKDCLFCSRRPEKPLGKIANKEAYESMKRAYEDTMQVCSPDQYQYRKNKLTIRMCEFLLLTHKDLIKDYE